MELQMEYLECKQLPNPFLNHLVIEAILKYTNRISDLKTLRLLSTAWRDLTTPKLMQTSTVNINSEREMKQYTNILPSTGLRQIHKNFHIKVLQSLETDSSDSFIKFILRSAEELHLSKCVMRPQEILEILRSGSQLKIISFNEVLTEDKNDEAGDLLNGVIFSSPLTRLEVTTCEEGSFFPWTDVFRNLPNLQTLHAQLQSACQVTNLLESMLGQKLKLKEFSSFLVDFDESHINLLTNLEFPLQILDLSISSSVTSECIEELLKSPSVAGNMETLKLFHETDAEINKISLPCMKKLKSLELLGDPVSGNIFRSLHTGCKNLTNINLSQIVSSSEILKETFQHINLISLSIEEGYLSKETLEKIALLFPKLKRVCLFLNDDNVGALFKNYSNLEEIIVLGTELTDLGIIGVNPKGRSCIGDCKRLRKFSLYPQPQDRITDMSILHGLLRVPELTSVELPETAVTNEGLRTLLKAKPNLVRLSAKIAINPRTGEHSLRSTKYQIL